MWPRNFGTNKLVENTPFSIFPCRKFLSKPRISVGQKIDDKQAIFRIFLPYLICFQTENFCETKKLDRSYSFSKFLPDIFFQNWKFLWDKQIGWKEAIYNISPRNFFQTESVCETNKFAEKYDIFNIFLAQNFFSNRKFRLGF